MLVDGTRNLRLLAVEEGILAPHDALQFRELCDHARHEIRLRELRRTARIRRQRLVRLLIRYNILDNRRDKPHQALCLLVHRAKPLLEDDRLEFFPVPCERLLAILVEEELCVRKACTQDALVAARNHIQMFPAAIAYRDEDGQEAAVRRLDREIALMVTHGRDDRLCGEREVFLLKRAAERCRILDEVEHLLEEVGRDLRRTAARLCRLRDLLTDHRAATLGIDDDVRLLTRRLIVGGRSDYERLRGKRTMSARRIPTRHICERKGHDLIPVERNDPADWADEAEVQIAPAHAVRQGNRTDQLRQKLREERRRLRPLLMHGGVDIAIALNELGRVDSLPARKTRARLRRIPLRIKGNVDRGAARLRAHILLTLRKPRHEKSRATRRTDGTQTLIAKAMLREEIAREPFQIGEEMGHDMCRDFLRPDLEQQILTHTFPSFFSIG